jgi:hypothetical protein
MQRAEVLVDVAQYDKVVTRGRGILGGLVH